MENVKKLSRALLKKFRNMYGLKDPHDLDFFLELRVLLFKKKNYKKKSCGKIIRQFQEEGDFLEAFEQEQLDLLRMGDFQNKKQKTLRNV